MNRLRFLIHTFFGFSRTESNAFILLLPFMVILLFSEPLYWQFTSGDEDYFADISKTDSLLAVMQAQEQISKQSERKDTIPFHHFDPNSVTEKELVALNLPKSVAARIVRYREKGGYFNKKEDLLRIFGMDTAWFLRARKYLTIQARWPKSEAKLAASRQTLQRADINAADSAQLLGVFGIGPVLAKRILLFRERLGGFISMEQLREVYGLDSGVVKKITQRFEVIDGFQPRMLMINEVSLNELDAHPYISRREAQAIIAYRLQHGAFDSLGQMKQIRLLDERWMEKVRPYMRIGNDGEF